ncbi:MAG: hypothetical protein ACJA0S_000344 [Rickettsiales bacterium]|jgi:hypothetical protein
MTIYKIQKTLCLVFLISILSGCISNTVDKININKITEKENVAVFNVGVFYKNNKEESNMCSVSFVDDQGNKLETTTQGKYAFLYTKSDKLTLDRVVCVSLRVVYNQLRKYELNERISFDLDKEKINYLGDMKIYWTPELFDASDLFPFGLLGGLLVTQDRGSFDSSIDNNYQDYLVFMRKNYPSLMNLVKNSTSTKVAGKSIK